MKKVYFFGTGYCAEAFGARVRKILEGTGEFQILGFLDNDKTKAGTLFDGYPVYHPDILKEAPCDLVLIFLMEEESYQTVFRQLAAYLRPEQIREYTFPLKELLQKNYKDTQEKEIKELLEYISDRKISTFNQFITADYTYDEVKWDRRTELPYIDFRTAEGRIVPMYYPREYKFVKKNGGLYVENLLWEQSGGSPHLYVKQNHTVADGDCIIDAGVCEGNFALKYVDAASHLYLFEMDPVWQEPLAYTFRKYESKVTIIRKALSDKSSDRTCRIDDVVQKRKVDFIKMDIEGAELSAICGAERTFRTNDIKASVCSYHRNGDEKAIRRKLEDYGYQTETSEGYMLFLYSDDTWELGDLRRGIVYGRRQNQHICR